MATGDADALDVIFVSVAAHLKKNEMWSFDQHAHRRPISGLRPPSRGNCFFATSLPTPRNQSGCADRWPHLIPQSSQVFDVFPAKLRGGAANRKWLARTIFACGCIFADLNPSARPEELLSGHGNTDFLCITAQYISVLRGAIHYLLATKPT